MTIDSYPSLREGLVGAWCPSIAGSGFMLPDLSGYGNHGTLTNKPVTDWVSSQLGRVLNYAVSTNQYVLINGDPNRYSLRTNALSLSAWARPTDNGTDVGREIFCKVVTGSISFSLDLNSSNRFRFPIGDPFLKVLTSSTTRSLNNWYHIAGIYDGVNQYIYVNSVLDGQRAENATIFYDTNGIFIGRWGGDQSLEESFGGQIDDCRVYNRALTPSEIAILAIRPGIGLSPSVDVPVMAPIATSVRRRRILTGAH